MSDTTTDPAATQSWWQSILTTLVLLAVGVASIFKLNLSKDALLALVPAASLIAAAIVAAVHSHSSAILASTRIQARVRLMAMTTGGQSAATAAAASPGSAVQINPANAITDVEAFARKVAATVREDLDRASTYLQPHVATIEHDLTGVEQKAREVAAAEVAKLDERLQRVEGWLQPKAQAAPSSLPGGSVPASTSAPQVEADPHPIYSSVPGAPAPTGPAAPDVPTMAPGRVA